MKDEKNSQQLAVIHFDYEGNPVSFMTEGGIMVNATEMAKPFGGSKRPNEWLRLSQSKEFIQALLDLKNSEAGIPASGGDTKAGIPALGDNTKVRICTLDNLVQVNHGGTNPGTWMHEDVALEFARWLSPRFGIWCNDRIKELLTKGQVELNPEMNLGKPLTRQRFTIVKDYMLQNNGKIEPYERKTGYYDYVYKDAEAVINCIKKLNRDIYDEMKEFCYKFGQSVKTFVYLAIREKLDREENPEKYDISELVKEIEMKSLQIDYLTQFYNEKEKIYQEKLSIEVEKKQNRIDYLNQLLELKEQTIGILQKSNNFVP